MSEKRRRPVRRRVADLWHEREGKLSTLLVYLVCCGAMVGAPRSLVDAGVVVAAAFVIASAVRYTLEGRRQYAG